MTPYGIRKNANSALVALFSLFFVAFLPLSGALAASTGVDVVLIMDSSGSMKSTDPQRLRIQAAKMFLELLDKRDRAAVVSFSAKGYPITPLLSLKNRANEQRLQRAVSKVSERGAYTNIFDAIDKSHKLLKRDGFKKRQKIILLMSDGTMDVGNAELDLDLTEKTIAELGPSLQADGIRLYTLAFTENSNIPLLKLAAKDTEGHFSLIRNANQIHGVFEKIFERAKQPDMLPIGEDDSFIVDDSIKELTVIASKYRGDSVISIETPEGEEYSAAEHPKTIRWYKAKKFDMITISRPATGFWRIKYSEGGNKAYILTDLGLHAESTQYEVAPGEKFRINAHLQRNGKTLSSRRVINSTRFLARINLPGGHVDEVPLKPQGRGMFSHEFQFDVPGSYHFEVISLGETFDRQKPVLVDVIAPVLEEPFKVQDAPPAEEPIATETEAEKPVDETPVAPVAEPPMAPPAAEPPPAVVTETPAAAKPMEESAAKEEIPAESEAEETVEGEAKDEAEEEEGGNGLKMALVAFLVFNVLAVIGGAVWYVLRRRKQEKAEAQENKIDLEASEEAEEALDSVAQVETEDEAPASAAQTDDDEEGGESGNEEENKDA